MKKYLFLTSVLALAACGGSNVSGGPGDVHYVDNVRQSNSRNIR